MIFDGHNDALTRPDADRFVSGRPTGELDLPRARAGGLGGGICAIFTPSPGEDMEWPATDDGRYAIPLADPVPVADAAAHAWAAARQLLAFEAAGDLRVVRSADDLDAAREAGEFAAVLGLEGAEAIDPGLDALDEWYDAGLRVLGPVWSRPNAFAHGVPFAFPSSPDTGPGLTSRGAELVRRCHERGIAVDLSHLNEAGFWDVARSDGAPLVASHSGCHALCPSSRNLTDEQLDAIGASGGLVGIVFAVGFVRPDGRDDPETPLAVIAAHARHAADRIGVEHVALGSDFDGALIPSPLGDAAGLPRLLDALAEAGFTPAEVDRIAWSNWRRVLGACWRS